MKTNTLNQFKMNQTSEILSSKLSRKYRKRTLEIIAYTGTFVSILYAGALWFVYENAYSSLTDCVYAAAYFWTLRWIKQGKYSLSAYWVIFWASIQVTSGSILFVGQDTGFQLYFLTLPVLVYFLLSKQPLWAQLSIMVYGCLLFIASHTIHIETFRAPIPEAISQTIFIVNALIVFGIIFFAVKFFADEIELAYQKQNKLLLTDDLTGLSNNRFIEQHATKLFTLCERYGHPLSLIILDIDNFREFNQSHGQTAGNLALKHLANILLEDIREADILARIGGDEFLIILPETGMEEAHEIVQRLKSKLQNHALKTDEQTHQLSASFGVSFCDSHEISTIESLIFSAHKALYLTRQNDLAK